MNYTEFRNLVKTMRSHQKAWFKDKRPSDLTESKKYERLVDRAIVTLESGQRGVFEKVTPDERKELPKLHIHDMDGNLLEVGDNFLVGDLLLKIKGFKILPIAQGEDVLVQTERHGEFNSKIVRKVE